MLGLETAHSNTQSRPQEPARIVTGDLHTAPRHWADPSAGTTPNDHPNSRELMGRTDRSTPEGRTGRRSPSVTSSRAIGSTRCSGVSPRVAGVHQGRTILTIWDASDLPARGTVRS